MTSQIRSYIEYLIRTYKKSCAQFIIKIGEKSSLVDDFNYDLMMILDSGLLFWGATLYTTGLCPHIDQSVIIRSLH